MAPENLLKSPNAPLIGFSFRKHPYGECQVSFTIRYYSQFIKKKISKYFITFNFNCCVGRPFSIFSEMNESEIKPLIKGGYSDTD